jgi:hypothetical protein
MIRPGKIGGVPDWIHAVQERNRGLLALAIGLGSAIGTLGAHHRHPEPSAGPPGGAARLIRGGAAMLRALLIAFTVAWEAYTVLVVSDAGVGFLDVALLVPAAAILAVIWALPSRARGGAGRHRLGRLALWLTFPALAAALVAIYFSSQSPSNPLFRVRFQASERALTRAAQELAGGEGHAEGVRVGLFHAATASAMSADEVRFLTTDCGVVDQCGLAYRPRVQPSSPRYAHIAGPWYLLYEPF